MPAQAAQSILEETLMSRREKLLEKMRNSPGSIRFGELDALLRYERFVLFNTRGSHRTYHHFDLGSSLLSCLTVVEKPVILKTFENC
jgi:hypothetical protein